MPIPRQTHGPRSRRGGDQSMDDFARHILHQRIFGRLSDDESSEDGDATEGRATTERLAARRALTAQAAPESEPGARERALRALAETAEAMTAMGQGRSRSWDDEALPLYRYGEDADSLSGFLRLLWDENASVLVAGARDSMRAARREAMRSLQVLAHDTNIASLLWADENGARAAVLAGASAGVTAGTNAGAATAGAASEADDEVRWFAHSCLSLLACSESVAAQIWQHEGTRQLVLGGARRAAGNGEETRVGLKVRLEAWDTLLNSANVLSSLWVGEHAADVRSACHRILNGAPSYYSSSLLTGARSNTASHRGGDGGAGR